jgi:pimeloyl-ACP methyl ester carboxylesterase
LGLRSTDRVQPRLAALTKHLDLKQAIHIGHSTGGGEVVHYIARHGESRVSKAAIIDARSGGRTVLRVQSARCEAV